MGDQSVTEGDAVYQIEDVAAGTNLSRLHSVVMEDTEDHRVAIVCPSCRYEIPLDVVTQEGGGKCEGCGRSVEAHITSHSKYGEWRNVPERLQELFR